MRISAQFKKKKKNLKQAATLYFLSTNQTSNISWDQLNATIINTRTFSLELMSTRFVNSLSIIYVTN